MQDDPIVITGAARTPIGSFQGVLSDVSATNLGATAIAAAIDRSAIEPESVEEVIMGCVLPAGLRQAPARQAALGGGLPLSTPCTTINKMCGSGMKAAMLGHDLIVSGSAEITVTGGLESMSRAPYLLQKARSGYRLGNSEILDHMFVDGLEDAYQPGKLMGHFAEDCAQRYNFSREDQDGFAIESLTRATEAIENGAFRREIVPVSVTKRNETISVDIDQQPLTANIEKIPSLKPAFRKDGSVTAANSSSISDGAAALVMMKLSNAERGGHVPLARVWGHSSFAQEPGLFTTAPIFAIRKLLDTLGWDTSTVDLFEINEAFAVVAMAAMHDLQIPHEKLNIHGGACALGHPVGASGARIIVTLLHALERNGLRRGIAALCIGGGEATAMAFERIV
ncbi:MAG: acetyl-CoA C-acyltransferase [Proteobacteria bacterium]|jgi:acetyl-CoA C-acetyltransferase|nr:acetyl-CoA C-acyltransferase [Pseudomonadota bacterium]MDB4826789.1 acetyl-CoA C-acyltransferase [Gammaproteobacteria bacterium]MBT4108070.1 acetyl-CoA C-acyltransferase [Pseudomonadota bacterium]MBT4357250.1 acetyl-CoA C-acyltransferase [Pseudomonadota bacterium]MBT4986393.1 acetyl-CoA C-acyltransferase [Pseudomonadota bacterium]